MNGDQHNEWTDSDSSVLRRQLLAVSGSIGLAGIAGCTGDGDDGSGGDDGDDGEGDGSPDGGGGDGRDGGDANGGGGSAGDGGDGSGDGEGDGAAGADGGDDEEETQDPSEALDSNCGSEPASRPEPVQAVVEYWRAVEDGDADAAEERVHPDGGYDDLQRDLQAGREFRGASIVEESGEEATVALAVTSAQSVVVFAIELRTDGGEWKLSGRAPAESADLEVTASFEPGSPEAVVAEFVAAIDDGDAGRIDELVHEASPEEGLGGGAGAEGLDYTLESAITFDRTGSEAQVRADLVVSMDGDEERSVEYIYLGCADGEWKIWEANL